MNTTKPMTILRKFAPALLLMLSVFTALPVLAEASDEDAKPKGVTDYIALEPAFVTHVGQPDRKVSYLKAAVTIRASRATTRSAVEAHMPRLRHELVMLFGEQTDLDQLSSVEGQQALREKASERINTVLEEQQTGESITGVLFTEFVVQR
ncbi:flagellar basal body-associated FliL family protein [Marinobacter daepoensis]|uniref:Flagellar protein FliL n=1 Tax=Marinobacter daepoensis TaxID=262077 RepID=A0ABS3BD01_9GAMM|nr:flagellar basal body-associated FliL family protein [Marinobacter daepoensis]MBN7768582.1 flagellar basal body-associated FliL family protein [Marinobacter daepoensis]MBY6032964.1 flagellar basal body-associated FliL family protein [Marinobacter daepoensis]MBY6079319.1 flagellar basal body-associated FliL family protein [Marinobacter daepoensis]